MSLGYTQPLYLLPFDHRKSYVAGMFHFKPPLTGDQHNRVARSKQLIYDGFREALAGGVAVACADILVDEEFGADILRNATSNGYVTAISVEKSGSDEFEFEYGDAYAAHLEAFKPTFAKVLVRYNPEGDAALNQRQTARLKQLFDYCQAVAQKFMFELLVPATKAQMEHVRADKGAYDGQLRPGLMRRAICNLQDAGVEPDVWRIEGLNRREDCEQLVETARRDGQGDIGCIVLGHGADVSSVMNWLEAAAPVPGFIGFAVGRTTFWDAVAGFESKEITRQEAVSRIAERYRRWVSIFEKTRDSPANTAYRATYSIASRVKP